MSIHEWVKSTLSFLSIIISWPTVILVLGWLFLAKFKDPISEVIRRLSLLAFPGGGIQFVPPSQSTPTPTMTLDEALKKTEAERETAWKMAEMALKWWWFEKIWNVIYRSQIEILEALRSAPSGLRWSYIYQRFYLPIATRFTSFWPTQFSQYMSFFANTAHFVELDLSVDPNDPPVRITPLGGEFLECPVWM